MSKEAGYFLDNEAKKKVAKARALDESLLGRVLVGEAKKKQDEAYDRIFGKEKKKAICVDCKKEVVRVVVTIENNKLITRCYKCNDKVKR